MTKVAMALLVLGALFLLVDHLRPLLADDIYCRIGAGELRQTPPLAWGGRASNRSPTEYCLHWSVWQAIMIAITGSQYGWKQDTLRDD